MGNINYFDLADVVYSVEQSVAVVAVAAAAVEVVAGALTASAAGFVKST
jgi:hypothetical protein